MIGHDLAGRYEIISRIGGGGMALVYKAQDLLLNRKVAIKVLRQQFVNDEDFIRRFRREGQSAAALSHPNVVSIFDVGQEDDIHYIVMEYVEGHNLNEIIQERAPLQIEEAVHISQQICDALGHAHQNQIIHRDIKPHNILIGNNGRVKVTDFGIARAVTSSTITHTGSVVGSVHYFSPEHAKGVNTGEKSDLYSLGIVMYQMLTGKLPFLGESPISIALKHLQENFEEPRVVNSHIPQSVENIILKAMRKNPSERYDSAKEMLTDLETCLSPARMYEPKITFPTHIDMEETKIMPAIRHDSSARSTDINMMETSSFTQSMETSVSKDGNAKKSNMKKPLIVVGVTLLILALIIFGFFKLLERLDTEEVDVPYVVGMSEEEARTLLTEKGLKVEEPVTRIFDKSIPKGEVVEQSKMYMRVKVGSFVQLTVSEGPELKQLISIVGDNKQTALNRLAELGITDDQVDFTEINDESPAGTVLEQSPSAGTDVNPDDVTISITLSKGPETVEMPDLTDMRLKDVKVLLNSLGLVLEDSAIVSEFSYLHNKDHIISQNFDAGTQVEKGSKVSVTVSSGYPKDAKSYQFNVRISPTSLDVPSEVKIYYSDARGENMELEPRTIDTTVDISVTLVLDLDTVASVSVYRDGQFMDIKRINYNDVTRGGNSGMTIFGAEDAPVFMEQPQPGMEENESDDEVEPDENNSEQ